MPPPCPWERGLRRQGGQGGRRGGGGGGGEGGSFGLLADFVRDEGLFSKDGHDIADVKFSRKFYIFGKSPFDEFPP